MNKLYRTLYSMTGWASAVTGISEAKACNQHQAACRRLLPLCSESRRSPVASELTLTGCKRLTGLATVSSARVGCWRYSGLSRAPASPPIGWQLLHRRTRAPDPEQASKTASLFESIYAGGHGPIGQPASPSDFVLDLLPDDMLSGYIVKAVELRA